MVRNHVITTILAIRLKRVVDNKNTISKHIIQYIIQITPYNSVTLVTLKTMTLITLIVGASFAL